METTIQIKIDSKLKKAAESLFAPLGLDTATAVRVILTHACETKNMPLAIAEYASKDSGAAIDEGLEKIRQGRLAAKGSLKGKVWMADDFDAPLEEFEEYM